MKPVRQTAFGQGKGNCLQAAIASVFELPLESCPHVFEDGPRDWQKRLDAWLEQFGLYSVIVNLTNPHTVTPVPFPALFSGKSPRGDFLHVVVGTLSGDGKFQMLHDPHPSDAGIETLVDVMLFVPTLVNGATNGNH